LAQCAGVGCGLVRVVAGEERARKVFSVEGPLGDGETSRLGSRDPVDSRTRCGTHGGEQARRSRGRSSRCTVVVQSRGLAGGRAEHAGFCGFPTKPSENGFLVWASKPSPKAQHDGDGIWACREASKRRTRDGIAWLASGGRGVRQRRGHPMARPTNIS
jgi:hypothetical protein